MKPELKDKSNIAAKAALDKKAENLALLDLSSEPAAQSFTDAFLICSGTSERQVQAIADEISLSLKSKHGRVRMEGYSEGRWILVDADDLIVHVFLDSIRAYYDLEGVWSKAKKVEIPESLFFPRAGLQNHETAHPTNAR